MRHQANQHTGCRNTNSKGSPTPLAIFAEPSGCPLGCEATLSSSLTSPLDAVALPYAEGTENQCFHACLLPNRQTVSCREISPVRPRPTRSVGGRHQYRGTGIVAARAGDSLRPCVLHYRDPARPYPARSCVSAISMSEQMIFMPDQTVGPGARRAVHFPQG